MPLQICNGIEENRKLEVREAFVIVYTMWLAIYP